MSTTRRLFVFTIVSNQVLLTALDRVALEADPLGGAFGVQSQELLLLITEDANQTTSSGHAVLVSTRPALPHGPVHIVEELQGRKVSSGIRLRMLTIAKQNAK